MTALLSAANETNDRLEALYVLTVTTGARQGELLALKWEDADLEGKTLRIRRTLTRSKLLNCSRQSGKSSVCGVLAAHKALYAPGSLVLLLSPSRSGHGRSRHSLWSWERLAATRSRPPVARA